MTSHRKLCATTDLCASILVQRASTNILCELSLSNTRQKKVPIKSQSQYILSFACAVTICTLATHLAAFLVVSDRSSDHRLSTWHTRVRWHIRNKPIFTLLSRRVSPRGKLTKMHQTKRAPHTNKGTQVRVNGRMYQQREMSARSIKEAETTINTTLSIIVEDQTHHRCHFFAIAKHVFASRILFPCVSVIVGVRAR